MGDSQEAKADRPAARNAPGSVPAPPPGAAERAHLPPIDGELIAALKQLALWGAHEDFALLSSAQLGAALGIKQQTASKRILDLQARGLVVRRMGGRKQAVRLTDTALALLRAQLLDYQHIFEGTTQLHISGSITSGLGEGGYYISMEPYMRQFESKLLFRPYAGTLNVKLEPTEAAKLEMLRDRRGVPLEGFTSNGRTFGGAEMFHASLRGTPAAVVIPHRTHHEATLELISSLYLRGHLGLHDGDVVDVVVDL